MTLCPVCNHENAFYHPIYGVLPGELCTRRRSTNSLPTHPVEFTSEAIKTGRKEYAKSALQPYRSGVLSKEYLRAYGTKGIKPTAKDIKNAREVWRGDVNHGVDVGRSK